MIDKAVSVIIPCFNYSLYIKQCIQSVLNSDINFETLEIIVVDDASTDNSANIVIDMSKNCKCDIKLIQNDTNIGLIRSRNRGIINSKGEYLFFLDADNYIDKDCLRIHFETILNHPEIVACYAPIQEVLDSSDEYRFKRSDQPFNYQKLLKGNYIDAMAMFRKKGLSEIGIYDTRMPPVGWEDYELWLRLGKLNKEVLFIEGPTLSFYRLHNRSMLSQISAEDYKLLVLYLKQNHKLEFDHRNVLNIEGSDLIKLENKFAQLFYAYAKKQSDSNSFSSDEVVFDENISLQYDLTKSSNSISFNIPTTQQIRSIRFDPINDYALIEIHAINFLHLGVQLDAQFSVVSNALAIEKHIYLFDTNNPQIIIDFPDENYLEIDEVIFEIKYLKIGVDVVLPIIDFKNSLIINQEEEINIIKNQNKSHLVEINNTNKAKFEYLNDKINNLKSKVHESDLMISQVTNSTSWKLTKPIRYISETFPYFTKNIYRIIKLIWLLLSFRFKYIYYKSKQKLNIITLPKEVKHNFFSKVHNNIGQNISPHTTQVDIVICVHNAIEDVKRCLSSIIINTNPPYHIILVDDGSSIETKLYLEEFSNTQSCTLIRNEKAQGYTKAANKGLVSALASYVVLLNSDTIIGSTDWLDRMLLCSQSDGKIGMISPLSNTASWQSIPEVFSNNDWADNIIPDDFSIQEMAKMLAQYSSLTYPRIPFLNGFCLLMKSECISSVGYFDEQIFSEGYGEENDFCIRAIKKGWKLSIADDVYVYHAQSKSYSHSRRINLSNKAGIALEKKHGQEIIDYGVNKCRENNVLHGIRSRANYYTQISKLKNYCNENYNGKKILFVLPIAAIGGGGNVILQEINALRDMQIDCFLANKLDFKEHFEIAYPKSEIPIIYFDNTEDLANNLDYFDVIIGTAFSSIEMIKNALAISKLDIITAYYIQDFEPYFFPEESLLRSQALDSYTIIPNIKCFTKTNWNKNEVLKYVGISSEVISPSVNLDIFRPLIEKSFDGTIAISAMIRPETPRRSPETTMKLLHSIKLLYGDNVDIYTFGCNELENIIQSYTKSFDFTHFGILNSSQLASLFNNTHIFIDMSLFQAMGLTGMEAMACNNAVILPKHGGAIEFINDSYNGFLVDTIHIEECLEIVDNLMNDRPLLTSIAKEAVKDICQYSPYFSSKNILDYLFKS